MSDDRKHILLGVTGSVAAKLTPKLRRSLQAIGEVQIAATGPALYFWDHDTTGILWTEADEWPGGRYQTGQEVPHIALGDWADILVIAPLTANTLTKMALGIADNLLSSVWYAWPGGKPSVIAPAMNTRMWHNPATQRHLTYLRDNYHSLTIVPPIAKKLACGTTGFGAMAEIEAIAAAVRKALAGK